MAFVLVDKKDVSRMKRIKAVVDQELFSAGNRIIDFVTVMNMDIHRFFIVVEMGNGKCLRADAGVGRRFAGIIYCHSFPRFPFLYMFSSINHS